MPQGQATKPPARVRAKVKLDDRPFRPNPLFTPMLAILTLLGAASPILQDPLDGQLPKRDLGVVEFLQNHPEYDGRGIRVAVLDTGLDPGHPFLQATPQGERKIVDWYDATTDGWIPLRAAGETESGGLLGLSGRRLMLGKWAAPGRSFSLGRIDSEWLPGGLSSRIRRERKETWEEGRRNYKESRRRVESRGGKSPTPRSPGKPSTDSKASGTRAPSTMWWFSRSTVPGAC